MLDSDGWSRIELLFSLLELSYILWPVLTGVATLSVVVFGATVAVTTSWSGDDGVHSLQAVWHTF